MNFTWIHIFWEEKPFGTNLIITDVYNTMTFLKDTNS